MRHFHINFCSGPMSLGEATYDNYEESLLDYISFIQMYRESFEDPGEFSYNKLLEATEHGENPDRAVSIGTSGMLLFWRYCEETDCVSAHMN